MITANNVHFCYRIGKPLFESLSLDLPAGAIVGLLGRNGEGKTTLLKLLAGQLLPDEGTISVLGAAPNQRSVPFLQSTFLLSEEIHTPPLSIERFFSLISDFYPSYDASMAKELLGEFQLSPRAKLNQLSMGQRKKAVIALALALRTPLLLMDEPTNSLDIPSKSAFRRLVARYTAPEQTILISTHQVRDLEQLIDHIVMLDNNEIVCNERIDSLSKRYRFAPVTGEEACPPLYKEETLLGPVGIFEHDGSEGLDDNFSMELFFNGVIHHKLQMNK